MSTLTMETLLEAMRKLDALGPMPPEIRESDMAVQMHQARVYAKRRAKSERHHQRMNKKWKRRYGEVAKPAAYVLDLGMSGLGRGKVMFVHPALMQQVRYGLNQHPHAEQK